MSQTHPTPPRAQAARGAGRYLSRAPGRRRSHGEQGAEIDEFESRRPRVLIADDEIELREALVNMLEVHGFQVVGVAASGSEAIAIFDATWPDLALLDYRMPGQDGVAVTHYIKARSPNTQIVLFTAYDETSLSLDATEAGVYAFLVKGCAPSLILQALSGAWQKHQQEAGPVRVAHPPTGTG